MQHGPSSPTMIHNDVAVLLSPYHQQHHRHFQGLLMTVLPPMQSTNNNNNDVVGKAQEQDEEDAATHAPDVMASCCVKADGEGVADGMSGQPPLPCGVAIAVVAHEEEDEGVGTSNNELSYVERFEQWIPRPGIVAMVVAALFFSLNTALAKVLSTNRKYSSFQVLYFRGIVTTIGCSIPLMLARRLPMAQVAGRVDHTLWALARGIVGSVSIGALYFGVSELPLTETVVLFGLNPVFAMMCSKLLLEEPLSWLKLSAIPVFLGGVVISADPSSYSSESMDSMSWIRRAIVVFGAACSGSAIVFARRMNNVEKLHWAAQGWWQGTVAALVAPAMSSLFDFQTVASVEDFGLLMAMGLCALFAQLCVGFAVPHEHAAVIGVLWNFDMVFALLWQAVMFSNTPKWTDAAGVACVFVASVVCVVERYVMEWWERREEEMSGVISTTTTTDDEEMMKSNNVVPATSNDGGIIGASIEEEATHRQILKTDDGHHHHDHLIDSSVDTSHHLLFSGSVTTSTCSPPQCPPPQAPRSSMCYHSDIVHDHHHHHQQRVASVDAAWYESIGVSEAASPVPSQPTSSSVPSMAVSPLSRNGTALSSRRRRTTIAGLTLLDERDPQCCDDEYAASSLAPMAAWISQCEEPPAVCDATPTTCEVATNPLQLPSDELRLHHHQETRQKPASAAPRPVATVITSG